MIALTGRLLREGPKEGETGRKKKKIVIETKISFGLERCISIDALIAIVQSASCAIVRNKIAHLVHDYFS